MNAELLKQRTTKMIGLMLPVIDDKPAIDGLLDKYQITPPSAQTFEGFQGRLLCSDWWMRTLRIKADRKLEESHINHGQVKKGKEIYCSDDSIDKVMTRQKNSLSHMETLVAVSDDGDEVEMLDILNASISNPTNRLAELMVRMSGFEEYAKEHGHVGEFYTITAPSSHHRYSAGKVNEKHNHNPKETQKYLVKTWSKIRASFARANINIYGFRVAEPHHDGTPHWHMLFFMKPEYKLQARQIMHDYACQDSASELHHQDCDLCKEPASKVKGQASCDVRFNYVEIDTQRGSATGYIAKYIAKNLGFDIGNDSEDDSKTTIEMTDRVKSWASTWGIRQFQQIGGASVSVWRELRKLDEESNINDPFVSEARLAADASNWSEFLKIMGGADIKRKDQNIALLKKNKTDSETGEMTTNRYDELVDRVIGVCTLANDVMTRFKEWQIMDKSKTEEKKESHEVRSTSGLSSFPLESCK